MLAISRSRGFTKVRAGDALPLTTVRLPFQKRVVVIEPAVIEPVEMWSAILLKSFHHLFISMRETVTSLSA